MPRNSSGTYSLPAGNPVVSNTLIQSTWANSTLSDVGTAISDSLDRYGRGAMQAALKNIDGTAVAPSITFSSEGTLGAYRVSAGVLGIAVAGALVLSISSTGLSFTNPLVLPLGTAAAPALTFTANTNTGLFSPGTNQLAWSTNGVQRMSIDATGLVTVANTLGVGGAPALGKLQVIGGDVVIDNAANYSAKNSGGTASSIMALSGANQLQFGNSGAVTSIAWATGGSTRMTLDGSGLQLAKAIFSGVTESVRIQNDGGYVSFWNTANTTRTGTLLGTAGTSLSLISENGATLQLGTAGAVRMTIDGSGYVGIGRNPISTVGIAMSDGTITTLYGFNYSSNTVSGIGTNSAHALGFLTSGSERARIDTSGNFLVGLTAATSGTAGRGVLEINGTSSALLALDVAGTRKGYFIHDGTNATLAADAGTLQFVAGGTQRLTISTAGVLTDTNGFELGYKGLPQQNQAGAYTLVVGDRGKHVYQRAAAAVTVPSGTFSVGDAVTIVNGTSGTISLTQGASVTLQLAGTLTTGSRTILANGVANILCVSSNLFYVTGNVT